MSPLTFEYKCVYVCLYVCNVVEVLAEADTDSESDAIERTQYQFSERECKLEKGMNAVPLLVDSITPRCNVSSPVHTDAAATEGPNRCSDIRLQ